MTTKRSSELTLRDKLSRLSHNQAKKLLGPSAERLIQAGGAYDIDIEEQVSLTDRRFKLTLPESDVTIALDNGARNRLRLWCNGCKAVSCEHSGAALSLILEEKMALGLSRLRPDKKPLGLMSEQEAVQVALADRAKRAADEKMVVRSDNTSTVWTDYMVTNKGSGRTYRVAMRGFEPGASYCSCPDFRKNTLGTCKHIIKVKSVIERRFTAAERAKPYVRRSFGVHLSYGEKLELRMLVPQKLSREEAEVVGKLARAPIGNIPLLLKRIDALERLGKPVTIYPDAERYIEARLFENRIRRKTEEIRRDPTEHPLRNELLKVPLLPYQLDGIAFAAGAGRAILADDMGLGKTIQGIGVAEFLAREGVVSKVLVICPASLKSQWQSEIRRFCDRSTKLVLGRSAERAAHYRDRVFFTICNYEQVLRDILVIEHVTWDLIILDEGQRIKNWEAKTTQTIKSLKSRFALVLTGTPLENRIDDLFSIVEFVDDRRLGPAFRFFNQHRVVGEKGKVEGYRDLRTVREKLKPIMLRRTRASVMQQLPPRTTEIVRIAPTEEQNGSDAELRRRIGLIVNKKYLTEMDMLRLRKLLLAARMNADSTFLVDKQPPGYSSKLAELERLLEELSIEEGRKIILFSEWTTMLGLIEPLLDKHGLGYVRLDGSVPQKKRQSLVHEFNTRDSCRAFITTNAGATGLNLQAANTVINVDLPWNPAVLEQRIARAHRMGQTANVQVFVLVTEATIEENMLTTLSAKHELFTAALDTESEVDAVTLQSGVEELRQRLEKLIGAKPEAPLDESQNRMTEQEKLGIEQRDRIAVAGGQLLSAAFAFLQQMVPEREESPQTQKAAEQFRDGLLNCLGRDDKGRPKLTVTLPDITAVETIARTLSQLIPPP